MTLFFSFSLSISVFLPITNFFSFFVKEKIIFSTVCVMAMASCQTQQSLYSWYDSEDATYTYTKRGTEETLTKAMTQYEKVISKQKGLRKVVPPGVNAEYGYLLCKAGKKEQHHDKKTEDPFCCRWVNLPEHFSTLPSA